jgi:pyrroline-5-carboxylate reductase
VQQPKNVMVYDISRDQVDSICLAFPGVQRASTLHELVKDADIVLLGVKPQNVEAVLRPLSEEVDKLGPLKEDTILTSIVAGVPIEAFREYTNIEHIVRAMPNTPVTVEQGCTVW